MTTITLKINERSKAGKAVLAMLGFFAEEKNGVEIVVTPKTIEKPRYNAETEKAIQDAKNGIGVTKVKNITELFQKLNA